TPQVAADRGRRWPLRGCVTPPSRGRVRPRPRFSRPQPVRTADARRPHPGIVCCSVAGWEELLVRRAFIGVVAVGALTWGGVGVASPAGQPERAAALRLTATADAIIMPGTKIGYIPSQDEFTAYATAVIGATAGAPGAVDYLGVPGEFWPATGLDSLTFDASVAAGQAMLTPMVDGAIESDTPIVVFGHSQSAVIATKEKQRLLAEYPAPDTAPDVTFVMVANPNRPNGGLLARFPGLYIPILGVTFNGA